MSENEAQAEAVQADEAKDQGSLGNLLKQFQDELAGDDKIVRELSERLQGLAAKREQLKGAIFAMNAAMQALKQESETANEAEASAVTESKE